MKLDIDQQVALLMQGSEYGDDTTQAQMAAELRARLLESRRTGVPMRVYAGFDPRTSDLHVGHTIPIRKLRQFQELGHEVTFVVGTATSMIGDPSDKDQLRPVLTLEETERNGRTYAEQAFRILDRERTLIRFNHEWLLDLKLEGLVKLGSIFTVQQFLQRENFRLRMDRSEPIYLHETFYALMQAYDALQLQADVQIGGSDQLFNIMAGRKLQQNAGKKPQIAIIMGILPGTDGVVKMSKSLGNHIPILAEPEDMYGKVMSVPDAAMGLYFRLVTRWLPAQIAEAEAKLASGEMHPRDAKMALAREIVSIFHDDAAAARAEGHFRTVFQKRELPEDMPTHSLAAPTNIVDLVADLKLAPSRSAVRRLVQQGGIKLDDTVLSDFGYVVQPDAEHILQVGKRAYVRLVPAG